MDETGTAPVHAAPARRPTPTCPSAPWIEGFSSGYMQRVMHLLPEAGRPGAVDQPAELQARSKMFRKGPVDDGVMRFTQPAGRVALDTPASAAAAD